MEENLKYYLDNTHVTQAAIESRLAHPITNLRYPNRLVFGQLRNFAVDFLTAGMEPRFISLAGLRGVGKTTLLWQMASYIHDNHTQSMYFFNVNTLKNLGISLQTALDEFQKHILKKRFDELKEPIVMLFDEVHDDDNWSKTLKILYDEARSAFILCTGSSVLLLNQTADLARRMRIEKVYPFTFIEFVAAQTYLENERNPIYPQNELSKSLKEYLFYSESAESAFAKITRLTDGVSTYFDQIKAVKTLLFDGLWEDYVNYHNIPNFLFYREKQSINDSILYGQNLPEHFNSKLIEDIVVMYLRKTLTDGVISFTSGSSEVNPDFVIETRDKPILLEIGTGKTSTKQIKASKINYRYGVLISNRFEAPTLKGDCIQLPLSWFLLL